MYFLVVIAVILLLVYLLILGHHRGRIFAGLRRLPGPRRLPFVGNLFQLRNRPTHLALREWGQQFGPVFKFDILGTPTVAVCGYEAIREVLVTRGQDFGGRLMRGKGSSRGIVNVDICPYWRSTRTHIHSALKVYGSGLAKFEDSLMDVLQPMIENFKAKKQAPFDCYDEVHDTLAMFICTVVTGKHVGRSNPAILMIKQADLLLRRTSSMPPMMQILDAFPWLWDIFRVMGLLDHFLFSQQQFGLFCDEVLLPLKLTTEFHAGKGLFAELCELQQKQSTAGDEDALTDSEIKMIIRNIVVAGVVTTTSSLYALLNILLQHPHVQEKVAEEVIAKVGASDKVTMAHKTELPYTRAVVLELLRFTSIVPHALMHKTMVDTHVQGYSLPKGTHVMPCLFAHHWNPDEWEDPHTFNPERFLDQDGALYPADHPVRKRVLAFGAGSRVCLGELLARNRLFLFTATLLQNFCFVPPEGEPLVSYDPRDWPHSVVFEPMRYHLSAVPREVSKK